MSFHDKVCIFVDPLENAVGFRGSMNETFKGLSSDGNRIIDVFQLAIIRIRQELIM